MHPKLEELSRARDASDQVVLAALMRDEEILTRAGSRDRVQLLWDVCQVPDFRKVMPDHHAMLIGRIFTYLVDKDGRLPADWVAEQIERLNRIDGDIDTLTARLAHIRTWTYITHRVDWIDSAADWQARTRQIEDALSDALHHRLTDRFVDKRAAVLGRSKGAEGADLLSAVTKKGEVVVEGHVVGHIEGLSFAPHDAADRREAKALLAAAHRALGEDAPRRVKALEESPDQDFGMTPEGRITWRGRIIARPDKGDSLLSPRAVLLSHSLTDDNLAERARLRVQQFLDGFMGRRLKPLLAPDIDPSQMDAAARGLMYQLREGLGALTRKQAADTVEALSKPAQASLTKIGLRFGRDWIYLAGLMDIKTVRARAILWAAWTGRPVPDIPNSSAPSLPRDRVADAVWPMLGYAPLGPIALRLDRWEQLTAKLRHHPRKTPLLGDGQFCTQIGLPEKDPALAGVMRALGFKPAPLKEGTEEILSAPPAFIPASRGRNAKRKAAQVARPDAPKTKAPKARRPVEARPNPDSPFAVLKGLVSRK
ncbi:MAG: hypothetical protein P1V34_11440 [Alphaproteobacteria bacterium]|nr:hypothetical protein [Alphaproteobacteria bacterium]